MLTLKNKFEKKLRQAKPGEGTFILVNEMKETMEAAENAASANKNVYTTATSTKLNVWWSYPQSLRQLVMSLDVGAVPGCERAQDVM